MKLKNIRFNLRFSAGKKSDGEEQFAIIRSLQDLKDNLNLDDLLLYFNSGQLARWLEGLGESSMSEAVSKIGNDLPVKAQLKSIFDALGFEMDNGELDSLVESYTFPRSIQDRKREMTAMLNDVQGVIEKDYIQYGLCLKDIVAAGMDFTVVKTRVRAMLKEYPRQFRLDWMRFYDVMMEKCRLAVFAVLMDKDYRYYFLGDYDELNARYYGELEAPSKRSENTLRTDPVAQFISRVEKIIDVSYGRSIVNGHYEYRLNIKMDDRWSLDIDEWKNRGIIKEVSYGDSDGEWEDAVDRKTKVMILHCGENITIRPSGDKEKQSKGKECGRFPIFDGLDFRTSVDTPRSADDILLYLEVK